MLRQEKKTLGSSSNKKSFNHQLIIRSLHFHLSSVPPGPRGTVKMTRTMRRRAKVALCRYFIKTLTLRPEEPRVSLPLRVKLGVSIENVHTVGLINVFFFSTSTHWCGCLPTLWRSHQTRAERWSTCWDQTGKPTSLIWSWTS